MNRLVEKRPEFDDPVELAVQRKYYSKNFRHFPGSVIIALIEDLAEAKGWNLDLYDNQADQVIARRQGLNEIQLCEEQREAKRKDMEKRRRNYFKKHGKYPED